MNQFPEAPQWEYDSPSMQRFAASVGEFVGRSGAVALTAVAAKAGVNHYDHNAEDGVAAAALKGGSAAFRWWMWGSWVVVWLFTGFLYAFGWYMMSAVDMPVKGGPGGDPMVPTIGNAVAGLIWLLIVWPLGAGVTWCRCIDFSLFRRGVWYKVFRPLARLVEWCPTVVLYGLILIPWVVA